MADPTGFLRVPKIEAAKRPVEERVGDWREVYERASVVGIAVVVLLFFIALTNDIGRVS